MMPACHAACWRGAAAFSRVLPPCCAAKRRRDSPPSLSFHAAPPFRQVIFDGCFASSCCLLLFHFRGMPVRQPPRYVDSECSGVAALRWPAPCCSATAALAMPPGVAFSCAIADLPRPWPRCMLAIVFALPPGALLFMRGFIAPLSRRCRHALTPPAAFASCRRRRHITPRLRHARLRCHARC